MAEVGIRALKQNASEVVARAASGESIVITDRGRPVAQLVPLAISAIDRMLADGTAAAPTARPETLPRPEPGPDLSATLRAMRDDDRA